MKQTKENKHRAALKRRRLRRARLKKVGITAAMLPLVLSKGAPVIYVAARYRRDGEASGVEQVVEIDESELEGIVFPEVTLAEEVLEDADLIAPDEALAEIPVVVPELEPKPEPEPFIFEPDFAFEAPDFLTEPFSEMINLMTLNDGDNGTGWSFESNANGLTLTVYDGANITVTTNGQLFTGQIDIAANAMATITVRDLGITRNVWRNSAIRLNANANLTLILEGINTVSSANQSAGISVPADATLTIDGSGSLEARGTGDGSGIGGNMGMTTTGTVVINGGVVTAIGSHGGRGIGGHGPASSTYGHLILNGDAVVFTNSIAEDAGGSARTRGILFIGNEGTVYGNVSPPSFTIQATQTLVVPYGGTLTVDNDVTVRNYGNITGYGMVINNGTITPNPVHLVSPNVPFIDADGTTQTPVMARVVTAYTDILDDAVHDGWWVVQGDVNRGRITVHGNVNLILADGAHLSGGGLNVAGENSLTIYAQSTDSQVGQLTAQGGPNEAGIGGNRGQSGGIITINGGKISATGSNNSAGIGGGSGYFRPGGLWWDIPIPGGSGGTIRILGQAIVSAKRDISSTARSLGAGAGVGAQSAVLGGAGVVEIADTANVTVNANADTVSFITLQQPLDLTISDPNSITEEMSVTASLAPFANGSITYQWYVSIDGTNTAGRPISGATSSTLDFSLVADDIMGDATIELFVIARIADFPDVYIRSETAALTIQGRDTSLIDIGRLGHNQQGSGWSFVTGVGNFGGRDILTIYDGADVTITGTSEAWRVIRVAPNSNVKITLSEASVNTHNSPPLAIGSNSELYLTVMGDNMLEDRHFNHTSLSVHENGRLVISEDSTGILNTYGGYSGLGSSRYERLGTIEINGGELRVTGALERGINAADIIIRGDARVYVTVTGTHWAGDYSISGTLSIYGNPRITVNAPIIDTSQLIRFPIQPQSDTFTFGDISGTLSAAATTPLQDHNIEEIRWYSNATNSTTDGTFTGITGENFTIPTDLGVGNHYFFARTTVSGAAGTITAASDVAEVTVNRVAGAPLDLDVLDEGMTSIEVASSLANTATELHQKFWENEIKASVRYSLYDENPEENTSAAAITENSSGHFGNLSPNTTYYVRARAQASTHFEAGSLTRVQTVRTAQANKRAVGTSIFAMADELSAWQAGDNLEYLAQYVWAEIDAGNGFEGQHEVEVTRVDDSGNLELTFGHGDDDFKLTLEDLFIIAAENANLSDNRQHKVTGADEDLSFTVGQVSESDLKDQIQLWRVNTGVFDNFEELTGADKLNYFEFNQEDLDKLLESDKAGEFKVRFDFGHQSNSREGIGELTVRLTARAIILSAPTLDRVTATSIKIVSSEVQNLPAGGAIEYAIRPLDSETAFTDWQTLLIFENLAPNTAYEIVARVLGTEIMSQPLLVNTKAVADTGAPSEDNAYPLPPVESDSDEDENITINADSDLNSDINDVSDYEDSRVLPRTGASLSLAGLIGMAKIGIAYALRRKKKPKQ